MTATTTSGPTNPFPDEKRLPNRAGSGRLGHVDHDAVLAAFNEQIRKHSDPAGPDELVERDGERVVRSMSIGEEWAGVTWSDLDPIDADVVIEAQIARFAQRCRRWEWKHYSYDQPPDLPERLVAAGFVPEPPETLLIATIGELALQVTPPPGVTLRPVVDPGDVAALVAVHDEVFGGDHSTIGAALLSGIGQRPPTAAAVVAWADNNPIAAGRVEFHYGTQFASLWGGGTTSPWRSRGVFRALVAHRAAEAAARGFRYLQVDASADSRPILGKLGFVELATTTPFTHPGTTT